MTTQKVHRVSVAMSVYNPRAEYFREQVDSILGQTSEPVLVMRNDGLRTLKRWRFATNIQTAIMSS